MTYLSNLDNARTERKIDHDKADFSLFDLKALVTHLRAMANEEHLKILLQGVATWNEWREKNREIREPDLRAADLRAAMLHKANLFGAILYKSNLTEATLTEANLRGRAS